MCLSMFYDRGNDARSGRGRIVDDDVREIRPRVRAYPSFELFSVPRPMRHAPALIRLHRWRSALGVTQLVTAPATIPSVS
jgi:hypothetical protein